MFTGWFQRCTSGGPCTVTRATLLLFTQTATCSPAALLFRQSYSADTNSLLRGGTRCHDVSDPLAERACTHCDGPWAAVAARGVGVRSSPCAMQSLPAQPQNTAAPMAAELGCQAGGRLAQPTT